MQEDFSLSDAKFICAVKELGTSPEVSKILGISSSSIGVYVHRIEKRLGKKLFIRYKTSKNIDLTANGLEIYPTCRKILDLAESLNDFSEVEPQFLQGEIKITATQSILEYIYLPHMVNFMQNHSNINLIIHQLDDMLRIEQSINEFYFTMEVSDDEKVFEYIPYHDFQQKLWASKEYLKKFGTPESERDLHRHCLLFQRGYLHATQVFAAENIKESLSHNFNKISDYHIVGSRMVDKLCEAGLGITLGSEETTNLSGIAVEQVLPSYNAGNVKCYIKANRSFLSKKIGKYFLDWLFECRDRVFKKEGIPLLHEYKKRIPIET